MNPYETLNVPPNADEDTIRKAYKKAAQKCHPDREGGDEEEFKRLGKAYEILANPEARKRWDETGSAEETPSAEDIARTTVLRGLDNILARSDLDQLNIIECLRGELAHARAMHYGAVSGVAQTRRRVEKLLKRLGETSPPEVKLHLERKLADLEQQDTQLKFMEVVYREIAAFIDKMQDTEPPPMAPKAGLGSTIAGLYPRINPFGHSF